MAALTEEWLCKLDKPDLVALVVILQLMDSVNSDLVAELRKIREEFDQMKSDLSVKKSEHSIIRMTPNYRKTVLGKCPIFQERVPRNLWHPIISQWQWSWGCCLQSSNEGWWWSVWQKHWNIVTELVKGIRLSLSLAKGRCQSKF